VPGRPETLLPNNRAAFRPETVRLHTEITEKEAGLSHARPTEAPMEHSEKPYDRWLGIVPQESLRENAPWPSDSEIPDHRIPCKKDQRPVTPLVKTKKTKSGQYGTGDRGGPYYRRLDLALDFL